MTKTDMLVELREILDESQNNPLWTPRSLERWLSEGQDKFCAETGFFKDSSNHTIPVLADTRLYSYSDRIIRIVAVKRNGVPLTHFEGSGDFPPDNGGVPTQWRTDTDTGFIKLWPTPAADETLEMVVWRYATTPLVNKDAQPEIPEQFRRACVEYAAAKAYGIHDAEASNPKAAAEHWAEYKVYVDDGITAFHNLHNTHVDVKPHPSYVV